MILAIVLTIVAALGLITMISMTISRNLQISRGDRQQIQPINIDAFRNLVDPAEDEYLRRRLPSSEYRIVQRKRLRATAAYVQASRQNAAVLALIGQAAVSSSNVQTAEAARQLVDNAMLLRRNATFALLRIYITLAWPNSAMAAAPVLRGYERLNGCAMLLGRLQNPAVPVRLSASL